MNDLSDVRAQIKNSILTIVEYYGHTLDKYNKCLCPFHDDTTPSLAITPNKGLFNCFVCEAGGDTIKFIQLKESCDFITAVKKGCKILDIEFPEVEGKKKKNTFTLERRYEVMELACQYFEEQLQHPSNKLVLYTLYRRLINDKSISDYRVGFAVKDLYGLKKWAYRKGINVYELRNCGLLTVGKDENGHEKALIKDGYDVFRNRIMFPILDEQGRVIAFSGRSMEADNNNKSSPPKYLNSPESCIFTKGKCLFGLYQLLKSETKLSLATKVEGQFDVLSLVQSSVPAVCSLGTGLTSYQRSLLIKLGINEVNLMYDNDQAGLKAIDRSFGELTKAALKVSVTLLPDGEDPNSFLVKNSSVKLKKFINKREEFINYKIVQIHNIKDPGQKEIAIEKLFELLVLEPNVINQNINVSHLAYHLKMNESELFTLLEKKRIESQSALQRALSNIVDYLDKTITNDQQLKDLILDAKAVLIN